MGILETGRIMERLNLMVENAINGVAVENGFDESKMSALETKFARYLEANNATQTQLAEEKSKINELISDISHQTKTPLTNILLYSQLLAESELGERERQLAELLTKQAEKLDFLIVSLVKVSRLETGIIEVKPKLSDLTGLLEGVVEQAQAQASAKGIGLSAICGEPVNVLLDPKWTAEALYNIVDNAIKYTPSGGSVTISIHFYQLFCCVKIADTGIGMTEAETAKIFSRFYRSPSVGDREGVGLGLYLAREIISAQGGYIKVDSSPGNGSVFSVFLPLE